MAIHSVRVEFSETLMQPGKQSIHCIHPPPEVAGPLTLERKPYSTSIQCQAKHAGWAGSHKNGLRS
jgi:hypothetical protein